MSGLCVFASSLRHCRRRRLALGFSRCVCEGKLTPTSQPRRTRHRPGLPQSVSCLLKDLGPICSHGTPLPQPPVGGPASPRTSRRVPPVPGENGARDPRPAFRDRPRPLPEGVQVRVGPSRRRGCWRVGGRATMTHRARGQW